MRINIHHMRCAVHTLQLAIKDGLKLPNCDKLLTKTRHIVTKLLSPNILSLLEKGGKKRPILDMTTRWASTYLMIKRLLELRESIGELSLLSPELHILLAMWSSLEDIGSVLEMPYSVTVNLQVESLTPGAFLKEWCALKRILYKREQDSRKKLSHQWKNARRLYCGTNFFLLECWSIPDTEFC